MVAFIRNFFFIGGYAVLLTSCGKGGALSPLSNAIQVSVGSRHACATLSDGTLKCWGFNNVGQLGSNNLIDSNTAVSATVAPKNVTQVSVQTYTTCVIADGGVQCWGYNKLGQFGNNSTESSLTAQAANSLTSGVTALSISPSSACAIKDGGVWCWGANAVGQLADGTTTSKLVPQLVPGLESGASGLNDVWINCAIKSGAAKCWGWVLAITSYTSSGLTYAKSIFTAPGLATGVTSVAGNWIHSCAIQNGAAKCWGHNPVGELGDGTTIDSLEAAVAVQGLETGVTEIAAGSSHSCAIANNEVYCWGQNDVGQLGNGTTVASLTPVKVTGLTGATGLSVTNHTNCVIQNRTVKCWGYNFHGQAGTGTNLNVSTPSEVMVAGASMSSVVDSLIHIFQSFLKLFF